MTIPNGELRKQYDGDGSTTSFTYSFRILNESDLLVVLQDSSENDTVQTLSTHYTVKGVGDSGGGTVEMVTAPAVGERLSIILDPDLTQELDLQDTGEFPSSSVEDALDKLLNIAKRSRDWVLRSLSLYDGDEDGSGRYDANENRIANLGDPVDNQDAATKAHVAAKVANVSSTAADVIDSLGSGYRIADLRYKLSASGVAANGVDLETRLAETASLTDFGVAGDGTTDDTAAVQAAVDAGGWLYVPEGTYLIDEITVTNEIHVVCHPNAVFKQGDDSASDHALFLFQSGSDHSSWEGGQLDGDASTHSGSYTDEDWTAIKVEGADYLVFRNLYIHDFMLMGFFHGSGDHAIYTDIHIKDCGKGFIVQQSDHARVENIVCEGMTNRAKAIYQHAVAVRDSENLDISGIRVVDFNPDNSGLEPTPTAIAFERLDNCHATNLVAEGFTTGNKPGKGATFDGLRLSSVRGLTVRGGYEQLCTIVTSEDTVFTALTGDMGYVDDSGGGVGVRVRAGGLYGAIDGSDTSTNPRANAGCRNVTIQDSLVIATTGWGFAAQSGGVRFVNCIAIGCASVGFEVDENLANSLFSNAPAPVAEHVAIVDCRAIACGGAGVNVAEGIDILIQGGQFVNNGQDTSKVTNQRAGIRLQNADSVHLSDVYAADTQDWSTKSDGASFQPGSTSSDQYEVTLRDPSQVEVGQHITLVDAGGSGVDATAKVVAKDRDEVTVEISGGFTFSSSGNLTNLTGTFSSSGTTLTGSSAALDTEVTGRTWVTDGTYWRRIVRVNGADSGVLESAFPSDLSGATLQRLTVDVDPIASQQRGVRVEATASDVYAKGVHGANVGNLWAIADPDVFAEGSEVLGEPLSGVQVASAASITLPHMPIVEITGTATIDTIAPKSAGARALLKFAGACTLEDQTTGTGNLYLSGAGDWNTIAAEDTIELVCDGTSWFEIHRSDNS